MSIPLRDKVVLITGASSGFGQDAARLFAGEGCKVALAARRLDRLQALAEQIQSEGGEAMAVPVDVARLAEIELMTQTVLDLYGRIDILFNNAGFGRLDWLENLDSGRDIEMQVQVNLLGVIQVARAVLPHMLARRCGHIINMSSVAGWISAPMYTIYAATKFGVRAFTDALRREVAPLGIHVSGVYPGPAKTEFGQHVGDTPGRRRVRGFKGLSLSSAYVARRVVGLAKRPRPTLIIPWWFRPLIAIEMHFPGLVDLFLRHAFVKPLHNPTVK